MHTTKKMRVADCDQRKILVIPCYYVAVYILLLIQQEVEYQEVRLDSLRVL